MLPAEKAKELLAKMNVFYHMKLGSGKTLPISMRDEQIKQCALVAVDERLNEAYLWAGEPDNINWEDNRWKYLQDLKREVEKL